MNTSHQNINPEVQRILQEAKAEPTFNGTVLEGRERWYTFINEKDVQKYVDWNEQGSFYEALNSIAKKVEAGRVSQGKTPYNSYIVINTL